MFYIVFSQYIYIYIYIYFTYNVIFFNFKEKKKRWLVVQTFCFCSWFSFCLNKGTVWIGPNQLVKEQCTNLQRLYFDAKTSSIDSGAPIHIPQILPFPCTGSKIHDNYYSLNLPWPNWQCNVFFFFFFLNSI